MPAYHVLALSNCRSSRHVGAHQHTSGEGAAGYDRQSLCSGLCVFVALCVIIVNLCSYIGLILNFCVCVFLALCIIILYLCCPVLASKNDA